MWLISAKTWPHATTYRCQYWDAAGQTTNWAGTQPHLSADRLPENGLSPQPPLDMPLGTALAMRGPGPRSSHQWAGTSTLCQETLTSL